MSGGAEFGTKYTRSGWLGRVLVDRFYAELGRLLGDCRPHVASVLEVGVAEGFSTERIQALLGRGLHYEASELEPHLVALAAARNPAIPVRQETIYHLERADRSFDLVICLEVLEHLEDPWAAVAELARVAGKFVVVSVPREPMYRIANVLRGKYVRRLGNTTGHIQHWSRSGIATLLGRTLDVVAVRTPLPWTILLCRVR